MTVFEREERTGGKIWSIKEEGYLCEWGPNGFLDSKPMTLELCDQIGVRDKLERSNDNARKRFIYSGGILNRLPENGPSGRRGHTRHTRIRHSTQSDGQGPFVGDGAHQGAGKNGIG